jgi:hypothetical protein
MCSGGLSLKVISSTWGAAVSTELTVGVSVGVGSKLTSAATGVSTGFALRLAGAPHFPQNLAVIEIGFPHAMQSIALPS